MKKDIPKYGATEVIQFVGVRELEPAEQDTVQSLSTEYFEKIKREMHNITNVVVHVTTGGKLMYCLPQMSMATFCRTIDMPMAVISAASRGAWRNGR